ncbi:hypothetical protein [Virgibacillus salexigens]|uniref:Uncharacterized protein n=1 Tax=Virgibacillus massiliensis TaxID=1462526 RepID=A0A024QGY6_9BACI|nr:hypothetical protein [Virgibacillus massiliensis]CDQ41774.1 hypothetical protein BN990_04151 [Virgibacillus massiliensis]
MNFEQIMMQQVQSNVDAPVNCRYCGDDVKKPRINSPQDWKKNLNWEIKYHCHTDCHQKHLWERK